MLPLPEPRPGGSIEALRSVAQPARAATTSCLMVAWLLASLRPGRALSAAGDLGRAGLGQDRAVEAAQGADRSQRRPGAGALARAARAHDCRQQRPLLAFDNLSALPAWLSDALCRLASGGSFAVRRLYTDDEEVLFEAARPIMLNGIEDVISRADLADRAIFLTLAPIAEEQRRSESELWREFELARPRILGALLDAAGRAACGNCPVCASSGCRGWPTSRSGPRPAKPRFGPPALLRAPTRANRKAAIEDALDADPVAACVREIMAERSSWTGSAADLLRAGADRGSHGSKQHRLAQKSPRARRPPAARADVLAGARHRRSPSVVKAAPEAGSSGSTPRWKTPTTPFATVDHRPCQDNRDRDWPTTSAMSTVARMRSVPPLLGRLPSQPQSRQTMLTQIALMNKFG